MKNLFYLILIIGVYACDKDLSLPKIIDNPTITVNGKYIIAPCGDTIIPKGVNYAVYNWGWDTLENLFPEIAKTGANTVRIVWYANSDGLAYNNLAFLDSALSRCIQHKMIPILELHDQTCLDNKDAIIETCNWFTRSDVKPILIKHKKWLMLNPVNEAGKVLWNNNDEIRFRTMYETIINNLRYAGLDMPLVLDASDCGQHLYIWRNIGEELLGKDPKNNLIFSAHTYWSSYAQIYGGNVISILNDAANWNIPILLGEIANKQDDNEGNCTLNLDILVTMQVANINNIGYLAWIWAHDNCYERQMTTNGNFNTLTDYGNTIVNTPSMGIKFAKKPSCW